jgi:hypothetical protein
MISYGPAHTAVSRQETGNKATARERALYAVEQLQLAELD